MFDEIRDFVVKNKIWFIIGGIICAMFGAVMAALISLYFLIAVAVGLIIAVVSGLVKNKEIKGYESNTITEKKEETPDLLHRFENQKTDDLENNKLHDQNAAVPPISETPIPQNNEELEEYKKEARERITEKYVQGLLEIVEKHKEINESEDMCSSLIQDNGFSYRGDKDTLNIIKTHFNKIKIENINKSQSPEVMIRGDIEVLFEVLTGCEYEQADENSKYLVKSLKFNPKGYGNHNFRKCFFEHTILCALEICKNRELLKLYTDEKILTKDEKRQKRSLLQFGYWDADHNHGSGSVLKQPNTDTSLDPNPSK